MKTLAKGLEAIDRTMVELGCTVENRARIIAHILATTLSEDEFAIVIEAARRATAEAKSEF